MAQALWRTIRELRMTGIRAADLSAAGFESPAKYAELRALLASYERFLAEHARGDMAAVFEEALEHLDWCPIQPADCWTELPDHIWSPLQRRLLDALPGERIAPQAIEIPGVAIPRRLATACTERVPPEPGAETLAFLMAPEKARQRRWKRSRDRRGLPPHPAVARAARPGGDRLRL